MELISQVLALPSLPIMSSNVGMVIHWILSHFGLRAVRPVEDTCVMILKKTPSDHCKEAG